MKQLRDSVLWNHHRKSEAGLWDGCIDACDLGRLSPHWLCQDDNGLPIHNPWSALAIFATSYLGQAGWIDISGSCDQCRCALDYPTDSASRLSMYEWQSRALGHGWGSALHGVKTMTILHQYSLNTHAGCITIHIEQLLDVGLSQHRCSSDELLQSEKCFFTLQTPFEFDFLL
jgi:hypothetical protein